MFRKILQAIRDSLRGKEHDYTAGSLRMALVLLAVPMILELSLESVFAVVDIFFVGKLGSNAIASVGLTESVITIVYSIGIGLSTAATAIVARRTGEKDPEGAAHAGAQSILVALFASVFTTIAGLLFAPAILGLMGASPDVVREGAIFTRIMLSGSAVIMLLFLINGIFRGAGDAAMAMKSLWFASLVNIVLCPLLIHFLGLRGAAIATVAGRTAGVLYQVRHLLRGDGRIRLRRADFRVDFPVMGNIVRVASPATLQFLIGSGSWIVLARLVAQTGGTEATAGYQIAIRNFVFFLLPVWGLANAAATLVGQNLGARQPDRAQESVNLSARVGVLLMSVVMLLFLFLAKPIIRIYTADPAVAAFGTSALRIVGSGFVFYALSMVMMSALNGAGDTRTPTWINLACFWGIQIPLAVYLSHRPGIGASGAVIAVPVAETVLSLIAWYYFRRGKWKTVKL